MRGDIKRGDLIYPEICYDIVAVLIEVYKGLGSGHQEKYYQWAIATELIKRNIIFKDQVAIKLLYKGTCIGTYFLDFLIKYLGVKIVLEIKKDHTFSKQHIDQVVGYLKSSGLELGILANFTSQGVKFKRIVNIIK
jgi:GxxExxY protein